MTELPEQLDTWLAALGQSLEVDVSALDVQAVLDLAGDAAHSVVRPAAPLTTFVVGLAIGAGAEPEWAFGVAEQLAQHWPATAGPDGP